MEIHAKITGIDYKTHYARELTNIPFQNFDINEMPASCILDSKNFKYGVSKWVSPKRTRSYPFERVYNTLSISKRITVIPIIKDEGLKGDRDYIQWDTVSLMSLLDVYVIFAFYCDAEKHKTRADKITNQKFDNSYVRAKILEINNYKSSALHWNLKEIEDTLPQTITKVQLHYSRIGRSLGVRFHSASGINNFKSQFLLGVNDFRDESRRKAKEAQNREHLTVQPKEVLATLSKATITIKNYLGGFYYFTTDEIRLDGNDLYLIEDKHSKNSFLPSDGDIRDGLLKMILYTNLKDMEANNLKYNSKPVLRLTSSKLSGKITSKDNDKKIGPFVKINKLSKKNEDSITLLFREAKENNLDVIIEEAHL